jgi:hypothetical protein
VEAK